MRFQLLGKSGLKVSQICLGTMTFGVESGFGAEEFQCRQMFDAYLNAGGNFIDTANIYSGGRSEKLLSNFIATERSRLVLASKFSMTTQASDPNAGGNSRKNLQQSLEASLKRLGTEYIDIYWVHAWDSVTPLDELLRALDDAVRAGKILYTGFSNVPAWVVARAQTLAEFTSTPRFIALQLHYSLVERNIERELAPCADALGLGITAWSPLGGGILTGKYSSDPVLRAQQPGRLTTTGWGNFFLNDRNLNIAQRVMELARQLGKTPGQVAIRWLLQRPQPVIPIVGARNVEQLIDLLEATEFNLNAESLSFLETASAIEHGYPGSLLHGAAGQRMVHGACFNVRD